MNNAITGDVLSSVDSLTKTNPEWDHKFWFDESIDILIKTELPNYYDSWKAWGANNIRKWDVARYLLLYLEGGLYADIDILFYKPLRDILDLEKSLIFRGPILKNQNKIIKIKNHFLLSEAKNPFWLYLVDAINNEKGKPRTAHGSTGSKKLGVTLQNYIDENHIDLSDIQFLDRNYVINTELKYEPAYKNKEFDPSLVYVEHFVKNTWK